MTCSDRVNFHRLTPMIEFNLIMLAGIDDDDGINDDDDDGIDDDDGGIDNCP